jgi:hypothetical protein
VEGELRLLLSEAGAGAERVEKLTGYLREELVQLDVGRVTRLSAGPPPPGARALDVVAVGGLLVSLTSSAVSLTAVISAIRSWLSRDEGRHRTIRLEIDGDVLELSDASAADERRLMGLFVGRHASGDGKT